MSKIREAGAGGAWQFWALAALLALALGVGGSSWPNEPGLAALRVAGLLLAAAGLLSLRWGHVRQAWPAWLVFVLSLALAAAHLMPLPHGVWSGLAGRDLAADVDALAGLGRVARPASIQPEATWNALASLAVPGAVLVLTSQIGPRRQAWLAWLLLALIGLSGAAGLLQAAGLDAYPYREQNVYSGLLANRNHQGLLLALAAPVAAASLAAAGRRVSGPWVAALAGLVAVVGLLVLLTGSRSGLLLTAAGLAGVPLIASSRGGAWPLAAGGLAFGGAAAVAVAWSRDRTFDRYADAAVDLRWPVWESLGDAIGHYLPLGSGVGTYREAYQVVEPDALLRPTQSNHAHNEFLEVALTAGVPGLLVLALAAALFAWCGVRAWRRPAPGAALARVGFVVLGLLAAASVTDYPLRTPLFMTIFIVAAVWTSAQIDTSRGRE